MPHFEKGERTSTSNPTVKWNDLPLLVSGGIVPTTHLARYTQENFPFSKWKILQEEIF